MSWIMLIGFGVLALVLLRIDRTIGLVGRDAVRAVARVDNQLQEIRAAIEHLSGEMRLASEDKVLTRGQIGAVQDQLADLTRTLRHAAEMVSRDSD